MTLTEIANACIRAAEKNRDNRLMVLEQIKEKEKELSALQVVLAELDKQQKKADKFVDRWTSMLNEPEET
jgi:hypothetical protein